MSLFFDFPTFRVYSVTEPARRVAADLAGRSVSYALFRTDSEGDEQWKVLRVDDTLLAALGLGRRTPRGGSTVAQALRKTFRQLDDSYWTIDSTSAVNTEGQLLGLENMRVPKAWLDGNPSAPRIFLDRTGTLRTLAMGTSGGLPPQHASVYPLLECAEGNEVAPEQTIEFELRIEAKPPGGITTRLDVNFPEGAATLDLTATVSSEDFGRPDGVAWSKTFILDRQLTAQPTAWTFRACARGERARYSLTIQFLAANHVVGALEATLVRQQSGLPAAIEQRGLRLPSSPGAPRAVAVSSDADSICTFECFRNGKTWARSEPAPFAGEGFFNYLAQAQSMSTLDRDVGLGLSTELPDTVRAFFATPEDEGLALLIASVGRVAPFEAARSRLAVAESFLGVERPILRWTSLEMPDTERIDVGPMACIRPEYPAQPLRFAKDEEQYLVGRFGDRVAHVATEAELEGLLDRADVRLLHFAGHADGSPAELALEGGVKARATRFDPARALVKDGRPFFFLNGCRAGWGTDKTAAMVGNLVKALLLYGFSGVVAPTIRVDSEAALQAARVFYEATAAQPVGEAVRQVRRLAVAPGTPDAMRASFLSYVAFAPARLRLAL
jgi:hypothetical protein